MRQEALTKLFSIAVKSRTFRSWQEASEARLRQLTDREILVLELVDEFSKYDPVTETVICKVLGVSPSSASEIVTKLTNLDFLKKETGDKGQTRGKPMAITETGVTFLDQIRKSGAARYAYLFSNVKDSDWPTIEAIFDGIDKAATIAVRKYVFGHPEIDFDNK